MTTTRKLSDWSMLAISAAVQEMIDRGDLDATSGNALARDLRAASSITIKFDPAFGPDPMVQPE